MKQKKFNVGDKVFAKVKGYPAWPATITQVNRTTYSVLFYGTREVGACKPQDIFYYLKYREKFTKNQKRKDYLDAVEEIDIAIAESGGVDGDNNTADVSTASNSETSFSNSIDEGGNKRRNSESHDIQPKKKHSLAETKRKKSIQENCDTDENVKKVSESQESSAVAEPEIDAPKPVLPKTPVRVGPRLTIGDIKVITTDYLQTVIAYASHVRENPETYQNLPVEKRVSMKNELVLVKTKSGELVGIKYNRDEDTNSDTEYKRALYDESEANTMLSMKSMLENGQCEPEDDLSLFETNLDITDIQIQESVELALIESKKQRLDWLKIESKLAELDTEIKKYLGLDKADPEAAENLLSNILDLDIEALMLLKHPSVFDMAKRLRRYVGNVNEWDYSVQEREKFEVLAERVRNKAEAVYNKFVAVLNYTGEEDPWDYYLEQVARFKEQVIDMVECKVFALTAPPTSRATFFDNREDEEELKEMVDKLGKNKMTATVHLHL